jgi:alkylated DNA nucleotide flippase Atl1
MGKTWQEKLKDAHDLPKVVVVEKSMMGALAGQRMVIAPPMEYNEEMRKVPKGKVITVPIIRDHIAKKHGADIACPLTAGIFTNIVAQASEEIGGDVAWWRTVKANGELNEKYPGGQSHQAEMLESEGHEIDRKRKKWFVKDYQKHEVS